MLASNTVIITNPKLKTGNFFTLFLNFDGASLPGLTGITGATTGGGTIAWISTGTINVINTATPVTTTTITVSTTWLSLTVRQSQFIRVSLIIDNINVSAFLVERLEVHWPDDGNGQCTFSLITQNPFAGTPDFDIESAVDVFAVYTNPDDGVASTVRMFKGQISHFEYVPERNIANITVQDMSRTVSRVTDKLNVDILGVDPIVTEKLVGNSNNSLTTSQAMDMNSPNPLIGIWLESDLALKVNLTTLMNYTFDSSQTIRAFEGGIITNGTNYLVKYQIPLNNFIIPNLKKSDVLQLVVQLAGIDNMVNERVGQFEDEVVGVNITANDELPLDLMRKIVVPQTWKVEFDEFGTLRVRREYLKATPDFTLDGDRVIEDTLTITKDTDNVINDVTIVGIVKRTGGGGFSSTPVV